MRLPRSSSSPFFIRIFSSVVLLAFVAFLPLNAPAATQQLVCAPTKLRFGAVTMGQSETQLIVVTNTGTTSTTVSAISIGAPAFKVSGLTLPATLAAGQSATLLVTFTPSTTGWSGWTGGKVTFTGKSSNPAVQLWFAGSGVSNALITASPANLTFAQTAVGSSSTLPIVLSNPHSHPQTVKAIQTLGRDFSVNGPTLPATLAAGQSVTIQVTYTPHVAGVSSGSVFVSGPSLNLPLTGAAATSTVGTLGITPATLNFGKVLIGDNATQAAVFTATGGSVTISSAASNNAQFAMPGATFPITIAAGDSVQYNVVFTPKKAGTSSGKLAFSSNASNGPESESVAGTGTTPMVSLGWSASASPVQGYNIYRGTTPGTYSKLNSALDLNTSFTDTTVATGTTYYYAATAVNSSGQESTYSSPVEVSIP